MNKSLNMIGLCMKAGKIKAGEFSVEQSVKAGESYLVIIAEDASDNTKKKFTNMCNYRELPFVIAYSKEELGRAIGKEMRATVSVNDENFAQSIIKTWR